MSVTQPPLLIVHGGGGVGKSHLIKTVSQWTDNILRKGKDRDNPDFPTVMLLAYTGVAAKNIGGTTFHSGLSYKDQCMCIDVRNFERFCSYPHQKNY